MPVMPVFTTINSSLIRFTDTSIFANVCKMLNQTVHLFCTLIAIMYAKKTGSSSATR
jgi:hypothetical protein